MKKKNLRSLSAFALTSIIIILLFQLTINSGCKKEQDGANPASTGGNLLSATAAKLATYDRVNLVSDTAGFGAERINPNLSDAWGIAFGPEGNLWISCNVTGEVVVLDPQGLTIRKPIAVPFGGMHKGASATSGAVANLNAEDFRIPVTGRESRFFFSSENGIVAAYSEGDSTITVIDHSATGAVYKGLTIAKDNGVNYLYVANFNSGNIEVYDKSFHSVSMTFTDPTLPGGYAPFNVSNLDGKLYVIYAKQDAAMHDDVTGAGFGYVDVFSTNGTFIKRFASQGTLNAPWGIAHANAEFGQGSQAILIGNFGDGHISVYDSTGVFKGQLMENGHAIAIDGLWALRFEPKRDDGKAGLDKEEDFTTLFFTAGPDDEAHGLFGYIRKH